MLKNFMKSVLLIMLWSGLGKCQESTKWEYAVNSAGAKILSCRSTALTPNGVKKCYIEFKKGVGKIPGYSVNFKIERTTEISKFNFSNFEGPEAVAKGNLFTIGTSGSGGNYHFSFCPTGVFVSEPEDGFSFGWYGTGSRNKLVILLTSAATAGDKIVVKVVDYENPKIEISADFSLLGFSNQYNKFMMP